MAYKHDYDKTLTRLNTILARLNDGEALSVKELAEEFAVSVRTIQRDFNERLVSLYPIYQEKKRWRMQKGFKLEKATSSEDIIVLDILEKLTDGLGDRFSKKAKALLSKIKNEDFNPIYAKLDIEDISTSFSELAILEDAIKAKQELTCKYDFGEYCYDLDLKPLKIVVFEGFWYLLALDARNDEMKKYHLKSISNIKIKETTFTTTKELEKILNNAINVWFEKDQKPINVVLYLDSVATKYIKRKPISNTQRLIQEYKDGSSELELQITHEMEILPLLKYWIPHIKVIEPIFIQYRLIEEMKEYLKEFG